MHLLQSFILKFYKIKNMKSRKHILTVANVGDSVCILSRAGRAVLIHRTHRLDSEEERARVVAKGGTVVNSRV